MKKKREYTLASTLKAVFYVFMFAIGIQFLIVLFFSYLNGLSFSISIALSALIVFLARDLFKVEADDITNALKRLPDNKEL